MKQIRINKQFLVLIICLVAIIAFDSKTHGAPQDLNLTVRGEKAIERLEQDGSSNSLIRAVKTDRRKNEPSQEESLAAQETKLIASDGADSDNFGLSVAISGNTAIVGSINAIVGGTHKGAAYIYVQSGGAWTLQQRITASDGNTGDVFGGSVDIKGDTAVVGARCAPNGQFCGLGAAYVFIRTGTVWTQQQKLTASDNTNPGDLFRFGTSVALGNDIVIVCAPGATIMQLQGERGAAYIYTRSYPPSGPIWTERQKIIASDHSPDQLFGNAVAFSGSTIVVGGNNTGRPGAAYFFIWNGTTATQQQRITASDGTINDGFSFSVAINEDTAIIGALPATNFGQAYIFTRSGTTWTQQQKLIPSDGATNKGFGNSVSMSGNAAIIGASADTIGQGSAYIFTVTGTTWTQQQKLIPSDRATNGNANDRFGYSVGISGDLAIVGTPFADIGANMDQGAAYVFTGLSLGNVNVSGRVTTPDGRGLRNATVKITDSNNVIRSATTSSFGFYSFDNVATGQSYTMAISSRLYRFTPRTVQVTGELTNVDFVGQE